jgi:cobyrinic acid a,c-diamide synthase
MNLPRIMLAAPSSGSGKTLITCAVLQALVNRGYQVASFKCGPDYIDPMFHSRVIGTCSGNLDTFFTDEKTTRYLFGRAAKEADISVVEGVMGYYDGLGGISTRASSAHVARILDIPVVLVVNCKGMSVSVLPLIRGFLEYEVPGQIRGVILNQLPASLFPDMKEMIERELKLAVIGYVPKMEELVLESRHLGLVLPGEIESLRQKLNRMAQLLEKSLDLDALISLARDTEDFSYEAPDLPGKVTSSPRIAVAKDEAFCFTYRDNLQLLKEMGAELVEFSPLQEEQLPENIQGLILSGGYPELHARELGENTSMREDIRRAVEGGLPCIAECGGFLYLHEALEGEDGSFYPMAGIIPAKAYRTFRLSRFGYITLTAQQDQLLFKAGEEIRGHEFHYWESEDCGESMKAQKPLRKRSWACVHGTDSLYAGFPHLFFYSAPEAALRFLKKCEERVCLH